MSEPGDWMQHSWVPCPHHRSAHTSLLSPKLFLFELSFGAERQACSLRLLLPPICLVSQVLSLEACGLFCAQAR